MKPFFCDPWLLQRSFDNGAKCMLCMTAFPIERCTKCSMSFQSSCLEQWVSRDTSAGSRRQACGRTSSFFFTFPCGVTESIRHAPTMLPTMSLPTSCPWPPSRQLVWHLPTFGLIILVFITMYAGFAGEYPLAVLHTPQLPQREFRLLRSASV